MACPTAGAHRLDTSSALGHALAGGGLPATPGIAHPGRFQDDPRMSSVPVHGTAPRQFGLVLDAVVTEYR